jgi:hypothetical protein
VSELSYSYSDFGLVKVPIYTESKQIIDFLETVENDGLGHYDRLDHLGRIRDAHKSAHHSRWEYMMLQMYLFHSFKESSTSFGFSNSINLNRQTRISSNEELLKCWTLLLNFGHLSGTFECERAWFEFIKENDKIYKTFLDYFPNDKYRKIAKGIFNEELYFKFHELIALLLLIHYKKVPEYANFTLDKFELILVRYLDDSKMSTKLNRCKELFHKIRRLAYILLDCSFSSYFVKINPKLYLDHIISNSDSVLYEDDSEFNKILTSLQKDLFNELYASELASLIKVEYINRKKTELANLLRVNEHYFVNSIIDLLINDKNIDNIKLKNISHNPVIRLSFLPKDYFTRSECAYYSEQKSLIEKIGISDLSYLITPTPGDFTGSKLDIFKHNELPIQTVSQLIWNLLKYIHNIYSEWEFEDYIFQPCVEDSIEDIFIFLLSKIFPQWKIRFKEDTSPDNYTVNFLTNRKHAYKWINNISEETKESDLRKSRKKEIECLKQLIKKEKGGMIITSHCNIAICGTNWKEIAEFDCIYLRVLKKAVYVTIVEAKEGITPRSIEALNDLKNAFSKINLEVDFNKVPILTETVKGKRVGYSYIKTNLINLCQSMIL